MSDVLLASIDFVVREFSGKNKFRVICFVATLITSSCMLH